MLGTWNSTIRSSGRSFVGEEASMRRPASGGRNNSRLISKTSHRLHGSTNARRPCSVSLEQWLTLNTYDVASNGKNNESRTQSTPWLTFLSGLSSLLPGDSLEVEPCNCTDFIVGWDSPGRASTAWLPAQETTRSRSRPTLFRL